MGESLSLWLNTVLNTVPHGCFLAWRHAALQRSRGRGEFAREFEPHRWEPSATAPAMGDLSMLWLLRHVVVSLDWKVHRFCHHGIFTQPDGDQALSRAFHQGCPSQLLVTIPKSTGVSLPGWSPWSRFKEVESERCQGEEQAAIRLAKKRGPLDLDPEYCNRCTWTEAELDLVGFSQTFGPRRFLCDSVTQGIGWLGQETLLRVMNSAKNMRHGTWWLGLHEIKVHVHPFALEFFSFLTLSKNLNSRLVLLHCYMFAHWLWQPLTSPGNSTSLACRLECVAPKKKIQYSPKSGW